MITPLNVLFFREEPVINNVNSPLMVIIQKQALG